MKRKFNSWIPRLIYSVNCIQNVRDGRNRGLGNRDGEGVVLTYEDHRKVPDSGKVQGLVEDPLVGGTVAKEGHGQVVETPVLARQGRTHRHRHALADDARTSEVR